MVIPNEGISGENLIISKNEFGKKCRRVSVKNIPSGVNHSEIHALFGTSYKYNAIHIDKHTQSCKAVMSNAEKAQSFIEKYDGKPFQGKASPQKQNLIVSLASCDFMLCVTQLPLSYTHKDFENLITTYGIVERCFLVHSERNDKSLGYGCVEYTSKESSIKAKNTLNGLKLELENEEHIVQVHWLDKIPPEYCKLYSSCLLLENLESSEMTNIEKLLSSGHQPIFFELAKELGQDDNFAVVEYESPESAEHVWEILNDNTNLNLKNLKASFCVPGQSGLILMKAAKACKQFGNPGGGLLPLPTPDVGVSNVMIQCPNVPAAHIQMAIPKYAVMNGNVVNVAELQFLNLHPQQIAHSQQMVHPQQIAHPQQMVHPQQIPYPPPHMVTHLRQQPQQQPFTTTFQTVVSQHQYNGLQPVDVHLRRNDSNGSLNRVDNDVFSNISDQSPRSTIDYHPSWESSHSGGNHTRAYPPLLTRAASLSDKDGGLAHRSNSLGSSPDPSAFGTARNSSSTTACSSTEDLCNTQGSCNKENSIPTANLFGPSSVVNDPDRVFRRLSSLEMKRENSPIEIRRSYGAIGSRNAGTTYVEGSLAATNKVSNNVSNTCNLSGNVPGSNLASTIKMPGSNMTSTARENLPMEKIFHCLGSDFADLCLNENSTGNQLRQDDSDDMNMTGNGYCWTTRRGHGQHQQGWGGQFQYQQLQPHRGNFVNVGDSERRDGVDK